MLNDLHSLDNDDFLPSLSRIQFISCHLLRVLEEWKERPGGPPRDADRLPPVLVLQGCAEH